MRVDLAPGQIDQLVAFLETLLVWRARMPLVSQRSAPEVVAKHVEDSFSLVPLVRPEARLADIGAGAGFPGLIVALACPTAEVVLIEPNRRKVSFLREAIRRAGAGNAIVVESRVEDLPAREQGSFDLVVSRALWGADEFFTKARALLRVAGIAIAMKAEHQEVPSEVTGYGEIQPRAYRLGGGEGRFLLIGYACAPRSFT